MAVLERSVYSARYCFVKNLHKRYNNDILYISYARHGCENVFANLEAWYKVSEVRL